MNGLHRRIRLTWFGLNQDIDNDGFDDLVALTCNVFIPGRVNAKLQAASVEVKSGVTGVSFWKHNSDEVGEVHCVGSLIRASGR